MPITISNEVFTTQKSLLERCDAIKASVPINTPITGNDLTLLAELLPLHPDLDCPTPMSEAEVFVGSLPFGKQGFYVRFPDTAPTAVGIRKAIKSAFGKSSSIASRLYDFKIAGRSAIAKQVLAKRREFIGHNRENLDGTFVSDLSGQEFPMAELAIDHAPPLHYDTLLLGFVKAEGINPLDVPLLRTNGWTLFADEALAERWRVFHQERAVLRAISSSENAQDRPLNDEWLTVCGGSF